MRLIPILTEKTLAAAQDGHYTFWVDRRLNKHQIKKLIGEVFDVTVIKVRTLNVAGETKKTYQRKIKKVMPRKKAIVVLKGKEKINAFEGKKK